MITIGYNTYAGELNLFSKLTYSNFEVNGGRPVFAGETSGPVIEVKIFPGMQIEPKKETVTNE